MTVSRLCDSRGKFVAEISKVEAYNIEQAWRIAWEWRCWLTFPPSLRGTTTAVEILNSRKIFLNKNFLKLTEKEIKIIVYLSKSIEPVSIDELQKEIWGYGVDLETHTVETHIHRLRKKIYKEFADENFIVSDKNGYKIN